METKEIRDFVKREFDIAHSAMLNAMEGDGKEPVVRYWLGKEEAFAAVWIWLGLEDGRKKSIQERIDEDPHWIEEEIDQIVAVSKEGHPHIIDRAHIAEWEKDSVILGASWVGAGLIYKVRYEKGEWKPL